MRAVRKPEVKSPAGYWPQLHAAIEAGADAVYFGLKHFTARAKAGFTLEELPEVLRTLHKRGVLGYVTFNTLVFDEELREAARTLTGIAEAGADAILVQDWGALKLAREIAPGLPIHGSTQMSVTDAAGVKHAQDLGVSRMILARELSLDEIRRVRSQTDAELEIFVHGALCVSYSGQCFSSEAWGGRSANRGQCAQACRLPYEMMVDGVIEPLADARYLLSPGDLNAIELMPEILKLGLSALKIEGRYKDAEYVTLTTAAYRAAVDGAASNIDTQALEQVYSRGLGPWFLAGTDHQAVVRGRAPRHRGVRVGTVVGVSHDEVLMRADIAVKPGDGIVLDAADWRSPQEKEEGGRVYSVAPAGRDVRLGFANGAIDSRRIRAGDWVWRTDDPEIARLARKCTGATQKVRVDVIAREGDPLTATWAVAGTSVTVRSEPLQRAQNRALDEPTLREQFGRLGGTPYELAELRATIEGSPFAPVSLLNRLRREAVEALQSEQARPRAIQVHPIELHLPHAAPSRSIPQLHLLVRSPEQLDAAIDAQPASITLDYLDLYGLKPSLDRVKASGIEPRVASPRVLKPGEERIADFLIRCECPILVRSAGLLHRLRGKTEARLDGDFSLNAANTISAEMLLDMGLARLAPTHDLNGAQITKLAEGIGGARIEAIAYQHLPVFHTEHCVFCRFLSTGTSYKDCGRPCEKHRVSLKDTSGRAHAVIADVGCRNTVFGAEAQEASAHLQDWVAAGIAHYRLEFVHENGNQVREIAALFQDALPGRLVPSELQKRLRRATPEGITEGSLYVLN